MANRITKMPPFEFLKYALQERRCHMRSELPHIWHIRWPWVLLTIYNLSPGSKKESYAIQRIMIWTWFSESFLCDFCSKLWMGSHDFMVSHFSHADPHVFERIIFKFKERLWNPHATDEYSRAIKNLLEIIAPIFDATWRRYAFMNTSVRCCSFPALQFHPGSKESAILLHRVTRTGNK